MLLSHPLPSLLRRCLVAMLMLLLLLAAAWALADEVAVPPLGHRVTDLTGTLSADQQASLEAKLRQFEQQKGSQIAVLMVPTTRPEEIEQYSIRVVEAWKLGRKKVDDGVLVLVAKDDHKMRIEVGYGLEGVIPDAVAKRIVAEIMKPSFKQGDFFGGINLATDGLIALINGEALPEPTQQSSGEGMSDGGMLPILLFGGVFLAEFLRAGLGRFWGGAVNAGIISVLAWIMGGGLVAMIFLAVAAFIVTVSNGLGWLGNSGRHGGGFSGGSSGGFSSGGGFSGGGGGFGGGGASGGW
jgi:uncharacterized protein